MHERWRTRIPLFPGPLIGREQDLVLARRILLDDEVRLVTLTGPPGVGKTSLALALAAEVEDRFADGARFVDLSTTSDAGLVAATISDSLGADGTGGPLERLIVYLANRHLLLVLDNFEQVMSAGPLVVELLRRFRELKILVTSRAPLRLRWEHEVPLEPLALPDLAEAAVPDELERVPAVRLFVERARAVSPSFSLTGQNAAAVVGLCRRLDGLPLAIELAAARARLMSPAAMLVQLMEPESDGTASATVAGGVVRSRSLHILAGGARDLPPRQRALRGAIDWSFALLDEDERMVFRRLGIFVGGCTIGAAEVVCDGGASEEGRATRDAESVTAQCIAPAPSPSAPSSPPTARPSILDVIGSLVEKSLLRLDDVESDEPRVRMLQTMHEYALEQLAVVGEAGLLKARHADYYLELAEQAEPELIRPTQAEWLDRLDRERGNFRAAARRAAARGDAETVLRLGAALWRFWWARGDAAEARERVEGILTLAAVMPPSSARARALHGAGVLAHELGEYPRARALLGESLALARQLDDRPLAVGVLDSLGWLAQQQGAYAEARARLTESLELARQLGDRQATAAILARMAYAAFAEGDRDRAHALNEQSLEAARAFGDRRILGDVQFNLGMSCHVDRDLAGARRHYEESRALLSELGHRPALAQTLHLMGHVAVMQGDLVTARALFREALVTARRAGNRRRQAFVLWAVATLMVTEGRPDLAVRFDAAAHAAADLMGAALARPVRALYDSLLAPAKEELGVNGVEQALGAGRAMSLADAVEEALAWLSDSANVAASERRADAHGGLPSDGAPAPAAEQDAAVRGPGRGSVPDSGLALLTPREREIAALIGHGLTSREIGERLVIGKGTADAHADHIRNKLDLRSRAEIAVWAARHGLLEPPSD